MTELVRNPDLGARELAFNTPAYILESMNASDEVVDFLVGNLPPMALAEFHASEEAQRRVWELIEKEKQDGLLPVEKLELEDFLKLEHLVFVAKAKAQLLSRDAGQR